MQQTPTFDSNTYAAVDMGSNSFHLLIARVADGALHVVDKLRERVQLAAGLDDTQRLTDAAMKRALDTLGRFGQRLRGVPSANVRAVGTQTLRQAKNSKAFLRQAEQALGQPIEVLGGREEARLIYLGVIHSMAATPGHRLVIDIGGGSTECILGEQFETLETESLHMGCISYSLRFFPDGKLKKDDWQRAVIAARLELQGIERTYLATGWNACAGASGTITAVGDIVSAMGWEKDGISAASLRQLRDALLAAGKVSSLNLPGLSPERAAVLPGGVAILQAVFESLKIDRMQVASGALREGLLHDLLGRMRHEDVREVTINSMCERFAVDARHAQRVQETARSLLTQVQAAWGLVDENAQHMLLWAARLHEVGLMIAHSGHHKHGAYVVTNADMPGFTQAEQHLLAVLVRSHRRKLHRDLFADLPGDWSERLMRLCVVLRLAVCLNRDRGPTPPPDVVVHLATADTLDIGFPTDYLAGHPLTVADLEQEASHLKNLGIRLQLH